MGALTVAKDKTPRKDASGGKPSYTTFRIFAADGEDLSDLADMEEKTISELYHELCAPLIRKRRIEATEAKLRRLKSPGSGSA